MAYIDLLKHIWNSVYDPEKDVVKVIEQYFHINYEQCINGVVMGRDEYTRHVIAQRKSMIIDVINYQHFLEKENELFAIYCPKGRSQDNLPIEGEVIAYFRFENQQILRIHGQVRLIAGNLVDVDMESASQ